MTTVANGAPAGLASRAGRWGHLSMADRMLVVVSAAAYGWVCATGVSNGAWAQFVALTAVLCLGFLGFVISSIARQPMLLLWMVALPLIAAIPIVGQIVAVVLLCIGFANLAERGAPLGAGFALYVGSWVIAALAQFSATFGFLVGAAVMVLTLYLVSADGWPVHRAVWIMAGGPLIAVLAVFAMGDLLDLDGIMFDDSIGDGTVPPVDANVGVPQQPEAQWINGYVRTNPDGIESNNLSFDGPGGTTNPNQHGVGGHWRSTADGIEANNLNPQ